MRLRPIALSALVGAVLSAGCDRYPCDFQSREVQYEAQMGNGSIARGFIELIETNVAGEVPSVLWHVRVSPLPAPATRVVLREGAPDSSGRVLYEFPLTNAVADTGIVTQVSVRTPYAGQVPFAEFWDLLQRQPASFEVTFAGDASPVRVGPLGRIGFSDWQDACARRIPGIP
jgi:hypothetical protein